MFRNGASRTIPVVLIIIVMIIAIGALITAGRNLFSDTGESTEQVDVGRDALLDTDPSHSVEMTVRGPIVGDEEHHSYQVTVSPSGRNLTTFKGYLESTIKDHQLSNNTKAYEQFVYALDKANFMKGDELTGEDNDTRGICADGRIYSYSVIDSGEAVKTLWTSTCSGSRGSLKASSQQLTDLFLDQIPDNKKLLSDLKI
ncbi:MAG: hypothetical protein L0H36_01420 [bacterium]|nr:hypothetical protein [bacterium]MDN5835276.1 hypothetical protein [bacterium]